MWRLVTFMAGLAVVVGAAALVLKSMPPNLVACFSGQPARGGELHTDLAVDPRIRSMEFTVLVNQVGGGAVRWIITDPAGDTSWTGRADTVGAFESGTLAASPGTWRINVISEADALTYGVLWNSVDPAVTSSDPYCGVPL